jgi:hypothetical protein
LLVAVNSVDVALFFTTMLAPGMTAPDASVTVPTIDDAVLPPWANADVAATTLISVAASQTRTL